MHNTVSFIHRSECFMQSLHDEEKCLLRICLLIQAKLVTID